MFNHHMIKMMSDMTPDDLLLVAQAARMRLHEQMETGNYEDDEMAASVKALNKFIHACDFKAHELNDYIGFRPAE